MALKMTSQTRTIEAIKQREKIQIYFWNIVGSGLNISIYQSLKMPFKKAFSTSDDRLIQVQIRLMQTEGRIRVQRRNFKVWIKEPTPKTREP